MIRNVKADGLASVFTDSTLSVFTPGAISKGVTEDSVIYIVCNSSDAATYGSQYTEGSHWIWAKREIFNANDTQAEVVEDEKVKQENASSNFEYRVLLSNGANDTTETKTAKKSANLKFNPSTGNLTASGEISGESYILSTASSQWTDSFRTIPFSKNNDPTKLKYYDNIFKYNPKTNKLQVRGIITDETGSDTIVWNTNGGCTTLATVATSGSYADLINTPTIPAAAESGTMQISADSASAVNTLFTANSSSATNAIKFLSSGGTTVTASAASGNNPATVTISSPSLGTGSTNAAKGDHTHTLSIATDSGANALTLDHGTKYKLTAGGQTFIFTTPTDNNTDTKVKQGVKTTASYRPIILGANSLNSTTDNFTDSDGDQVYYSNKLRVQPSTGNVLTTGDITADTLTVSSTSASPHLLFSRAGWNYIKAPTDGKLNFVVDGQSVSEANSEMVISNGAIYPGTAAATNLGKSTNAWGNYYGKGDITLYNAGDTGDTPAIKFIRKDEGDSTNDWRILGASGYLSIDCSTSSESEGAYVPKFQIGRAGANQTINGFQAMSGSSITASDTTFWNTNGGAKTAAEIVSAGGGVTTNSQYNLTLNGTINGTSGGTSLGTLYAPTGVGSAGQVLMSSGSGAPDWSGDYARWKKLTRPTDGTLDFNSITTPGFYNMSESVPSGAAEGATIHDYVLNSYAASTSTSIACGLEVIRTASATSYIVQTAYNSSGNVYRRKRSNNTWGSWTQLSFTDTDTKVTQTHTTTSGYRPVLLSYATDANGATDQVYYNTDVKVNPSTGELIVDGDIACYGDIRGYRINADSTISAGGNITSGGNITASTGTVTATAMYQTSDIRKKDVKSELDLQKCYDLIDKCSTVVYSWKNDEEHRDQIGMIAQEVYEFFPEIVNIDEEGFMSLDYAKLTVICIRVLKDLIDKVKGM